jgi:hypothetical protein
MPEPTGPRPANAGKPAVPSGRRAYVRYPCRALPGGQVFPLTTFDVQHALIVNVSQNGAGLILGRRIEPGTKVRLQWQNATQTIALELDARVAHATAREEGDWLIGCAFDRPLCRQELRALLA